MSEIKSIGDAGDSMPNSSETNDNPVCEMVRCLKLALQCGDHQSLRMTLEKLESWKQQKEEDSYRDYWRVAQLIGETELKSMYILVTVTSEKPENVRWIYLRDALAVLSMSLCNREIIFSALVYTSNILSVLSMALLQDTNEEVCLKAMSIVNKMLVVCRLRFARLVLSSPLHDALMEKVQPQLVASPRTVEMVLQIIKSLLMCGQESVHDYAVQLVQKLRDVPLKEGMIDRNQNRISVAFGISKFYEDLAKSVCAGETPEDCALYWTKEKSRKELLQECLDQPRLIIHCSWPPCGVHNQAPQMFFRKCSACLVVRYCSRQCQTQHWEAGHHRRCKVLANRNKAVGNSVLGSV